MTVRRLRAAVALLLSSCVGVTALGAGGLVGAQARNLTTAPRAATAPAMIHLKVSPNQIKQGRDVTLIITASGNGGKPLNAQISLTGAGQPRTGLARGGALHLTIRAMALGQATLRATAFGYLPATLSLPIVPGSPATLEAIRKGVSVLVPRQRPRPGSVGADLLANYHAITGSGQFASLGLRDGTLADLNANTDVVIHDPLHSTLSKGELFLEVVHGSGSHQVQIGNAVVATKGTRLDIAYNPRTRLTTVTVVEGLVQVSNRGATVLVGAGQQTTVVPTRPPAPPTPSNVGKVVAWIKNLPNSTPTTVPPYLNLFTPAPPTLTPPAGLKPAITLTGALTTHTISGVVEITGNATIAAGTTITIAPGAIVLMGNGASLDIQGVLRAVGTAAAPIVFTSAAPTPKAGDWQYIRFNGAGAAASVLSYVHVFDGSTGYGVNGMVALISGANMTIANSYFGQSSSVALYVDDGTRPTISDCTFANDSLDGKGEYALSAPIDDLALFTNLHTVPGQNGVGLRPGTLAHPGTWRGFAPPFVLTGNVTIPAKLKLTITPGTVVGMGSGTSLEVEGTLDAAGTAASPITFTSASQQPQPGDWQYIRFNGAGAVASTFRHVQVFYGSSGYGVSGMVAIISGANLALQDDYFAQGTTTAVWVDDGSRPTISNCTFAGDGGLAIDANVDEMTMISAMHLGEGQLGLSLRPGAIAHGGTWPQMEIPITLGGNVTIPAGQTLTVAPGATVAMTTGVSLEVEGVLHAVGTAAAPITFTSAQTQPKPGDWQYIRFNGAGASASVLSYVQALYGSNGYGVQGTIAVISGARPTISNSFMADGLSIGIWIDDTSRPTITNCLVTAYTGQAVQAPLDEMPHITALSVGAGQIGLWLRSGTISEGGTWPLLPIPINLAGSVTLAKGVTLSLSPGVTIAMTSSVSLEIEGTLHAVGTGASPITFTSALPTPKPGDWQYIRFNSAPASGSVLAFTHIEFGGTGYGVPSMIEAINGANMTLQNSLIEQGTAIGFSADNASLPTITGNTFRALAGAAISIPNADVTKVSGNQFPGGQQGVVTHT